MCAETEFYEFKLGRWTTSTIPPIQQLIFMCHAVYHQPNKFAFFPPGVKQLKWKNLRLVVLIWVWRLFLQKEMKFDSGPVLSKDSGPVLSKQKWELSDDSCIVFVPRAV